MGRASLIAVLGFIVIFGTIRGNLDKTSEDSQLNTSVFTEAILARHVTNIAVNYIMSIHSETGVTHESFSDSSFLDGSYDANIRSLGTDSTLDYDTLEISVDGQYEDETHTTRVQFISKSLLMPRITASVAVESDCTLFNFSGSGAQISGVDWLMDGTAPNPDGEDLSGLTLSNDADSARLISVIGGDTLNTWVTGDPIVEVSTDTPIVSLDELVAYYAGIADLTYAGGNFNSVSWGTEENPVVIYINGNIFFGGNSVGYGVLAINGSLSMGGNPSWHGLIIASGGESLVIDASFGTPTIYGALHIGASVTELTLKGSADIFYSSEAIDMVRVSLEERGLDRRMISEQIWYE